MTGIEIAAVAAAVGIAKNLKDLTSSLGASVPTDVRDEIVALFDKLMDVQTEVLAAQGRDIKLTERCRKLEDDLRRVEAWEAERARYALQKRGSKKYVYELRRERANGEPQHWLCSKCFAEGRKSILQGLDRGRWHCLPCGSTLYVGLDTHP